MLTSGSTENAKAVCLTHDNIYASLIGKSIALPSSINTSFFNFIGLDHVGGLIEIHLHAIFLVRDQIHVQAQDLMAEPLLFLCLGDKHKISNTFMPNFFLAKLRRSIESPTPHYLEKEPDLSCLTHIASGGEANVVETAEALTHILAKYGAPRNVNTTAWVMTETRAGSVFNDSCPEYDLRRGHEFASVGQCCPGIEMRTNAGSSTEPRTTSNEPGSLEVKGPIVFEQYFNNPEATKESFTADRWLKTGDEAVIDDCGKLNIVGRTKELMNIKGVKYLPHELEFAI